MLEAKIQHIVHMDFASRQNEYLNQIAQGQAKEIVYGVLIRNTE